MYEKAVHVILADYGKEFGWGVSSPQLNLIGGRDTLPDLRRDLPGILEFSGWDGKAPGVEHLERLRIVDDVELLIRLATDEFYEERSHVLNRIGQMLGHPISQSALISEVVSTPAGDYIIGCGLVSDTLGWWTEQMNSHGDTINIAAEPSGRPLQFIRLITAQPDIETDFRDAKDFGFGPNTRLADLLEAQQARPRTPADRTTPQGVRVRAA